MKKLVFALIALSSVAAQAQLDAAGQACGAYTQMRTVRESDLNEALKSMAKLSLGAAELDQDDENREAALQALSKEVAKASKLRKEIVELKKAQSEVCE